MRTLLVLAATSTLAYVGTQSAPVPTSSTSQNVEERGQVITRPGVVDQGNRPIWRGQPPGNPALPGALACTVVVNGQATGTFPFAWDGQGYRGNVTVGTSGSRLVFLNLYRGHILPSGQENFGWAVSPLGSGPRPGSAFYGRVQSLVPLRVDVPVALDWSQFAGGQSVRFVFTQ